MTQEEYINLSELQEFIKFKIGNLDLWVKAEIESHSVSRGHHYFGLIQKSEEGVVLSRARATLWASKAGITNTFERLTGRRLEAGLEVVLRVKVDYHPVYGLSLNIADIDTGFTIGQRELQKRQTIERIKKEGLETLQQELSLPYLPFRLAVISSDTAAGYGDFTNQLAENDYGYKFNCTLFQSVMQGEDAPESISSSIAKICSSGNYDIILIFRGGGSQADLYCYDDYLLARSIALCPLPVLTAIGHERDFHIADMVAREHFKTPTALAVYLIDWVSKVEEEMEMALNNICKALTDRIYALENETQRCLGNIRFALTCIINVMDNSVALYEANIKAADPRGILRQGYVLAVDGKGNILKGVHSKSKGDDFSLRFSDGLWECRINNVKEQL